MVPPGERELLARRKAPYSSNNDDSSDPQNVAVVLRVFRAIACPGNTHRARGRPRGAAQDGGARSVAQRSWVTRQTHRDEPGTGAGGRAREGTDGSRNA